MSVMLLFPLSQKANSRAAKLHYSDLEDDTSGAALVNDGRAICTLCVDHVESPITSSVAILALIWEWVGNAALRLGMDRSAGTLRAKQLHSHTHTHTHNTLHTAALSHTHTHTHTHTHY